MNKAKLNFYAARLAQSIIRVNAFVWPCILLLCLGLTQVSFAQQVFPPHIPKVDVKVYDEVYGGHLFFTPRVTDGSVQYPNAIVLADSVGDYIWYHIEDINGAPSNMRLRDFKVFYDGTMAFGSWINAFSGHQYFLMDSNFNITDTIICDGAGIDNHDIQKTTDGHYHHLCFTDSIMDASILTNNMGLPGSQNALVLGHGIKEFDENMNLIWEWNALDHFPLTDMYDDDFFNTDTSFVDFTHSNAFDVDIDGNYILSSRHLNEITRVSRLDGSIMWRLGGKQSTFTFVNDSARISGQHDCRMLANGNITIYDNATASNPAISRGVEYELDLLNGTATRVWEYKNPWNVPAGFIGSMQRQPNGNNLIGWGGVFPLNVTRSAYELRPNGDLAMDLDVTGGLTYRIKKHDLPFTLDRPDLTYNSFTFMLTAEAGHDEYVWNTGATTQTIQIEEAGGYKAFVNYGAGFLGSKQFNIPDVFDSTWTNNVADVSAKFNWLPVAGALSYNVRYKKTSATTYLTASAGGSSYTALGLEPGAHYDWQVQAVFGATNSLYSLNNEFTTISFGPPVPIFTSNVTLTNATLNWTPNSNATEYFLRGKPLSATSYLYFVLPGSQSSLSLSALPSGSTYNWQIAAIFDEGISSFSPMDTFSTLTCAPPTSLNTTAVTSTSASLNWTPAPAAFNYTLGGRPVGSGAFITVFISNPAASTFSASGLFPGTSYEWTIVSHCPGGLTSAIAPLNVFTTAPSAGEKFAAGGMNSFELFSQPIELYPNPATDLLTINVKNNFDETTYDVVIQDINGKTVFTSANNERNELNINTSEFQNGVYLVNIISDAVRQTKKVIIAR